ncbi:MAG: GDP-L-fucose synthase [Fimbriimonadaceae bacterium]|jgi:GDP-L-fucose synthase|nr:GDP-L-fucose synthase [Fimbriimonadaceae bacterium]
MDRDSKIFVAGHRGLVGSAIVRRLEKEGASQLILKTRSELDLMNRSQVDKFFQEQKPDYVFLAAAKVGGIHANRSYPADFLLDNLEIQNNVIRAAFETGVKKLLFLGSSCIYPKHAPQPMAEDCLLTGPLEATNEAYAIAKIAGLKLCQALHQQHGFPAISLMPTNLYGPNDNFDLENSHVLPAMIRKFHSAEGTVTLWGSGTPRREFLHADDLADASVYLMRNYDSPELINVGVGEDVSIKELAEQVAKTVGFKGEMVWDSSMPDGTPRKLMDVRKLHQTGWKAKISLEEGLASTYRWFLDHSGQARL